MTVKADNKNKELPSSPDMNPLLGLSVSDGRVLQQIVERLCGSGDLKAQEAKVVGIVFEKLSQSIENSQGKE